MYYVGGLVGTQGSFYHASSYFMWTLSIFFLCKKYFVVGKEGGKESREEEVKIRNRARKMKFPIQRTKTVSVGAGVRFQSSLFPVWHLPLHHTSS